MSGKATVYLTITTEVEIPHSDYLGSSASVDEHIKKAVDQVKHWKVLIQKNGAVEAKVVPSRVKVNYVNITEVD